MNYKSAIATPTIPPPKAVETPYLTIDDVYRELNSHRLSLPPVLCASTKHTSLEDVSEYVSNMFTEMTSYWKSKGYLSKANVPGFCDMLKDIFHVEYIPISEGDDETISV
jgi:hypothetical protein